MKPALTAEEWRTSWFSARHFQGEFPLYINGVHQPENEIKQAAFLLFDASFGFTREDVEGLRELAKQYDDEADNYEITGPAAIWLSSLADRIEALLPPEVV